MPRIRYFAYGSNMLTARLERRCPSAAVLTTAVARNFSVGFHKRGVDASGKAALVAVNDTTVITVGTVFEIDAREIEQLDRTEGSGYRRLQRFRVRCTRSGDVLQTHTYAAVEHHSDLVPYDWYLALVLAGIAEHGLGEAYASRFRSLDSVHDRQLERPSRREALQALSSVGIDDYRALLTELA